MTEPFENKKSVLSAESSKEAYLFNEILEVWWQGWPSGESTCLPPMWPGFDFRTRLYMWIEFVGSLLCYERFHPGYKLVRSFKKHVRASG